MSEAEFCFDEGQYLADKAQYERERKAEPYEKRIANQREEIRRLHKTLNNLAQSRTYWKREAERMGKQLYDALKFDVLNKKQSGWISVDERLPEEEVRVLVHLDIEGNYTNIDTDRILFGRWVRWNSFITHWMPLPEPPKGEHHELPRNLEE